MPIQLKLLTELPFSQNALYNQSISRHFPSQISLRPSQFLHRSNILDAGVFKLSLCELHFSWRKQTFPSNCYPISTGQSTILAQRPSSGIDPSMAEQTFHHRHRYHRFVMVGEEKWEWMMAGRGGGDRGIGEFPLVLRQIKSLNLCSHPELIAEFPGRYAPLSLHHHHSCNILCHLSGNSFAIKFNAFFLTRISRFILRFFFAQHFLLHHRFLLKLTLSLVRGGGGW